MSSTITDNALFQSRKNCLEAKTFSLNDCEFTDTQHMLTAKAPVEGGPPVFTLTVKVSSRDFHDLSKHVEEAVRLFGEEQYMFDKPEGYDNWSFSSRDEYRFRDQHSKTGLIPVYSTNMHNYLIPRPSERILSSSQIRHVYSRSLRAPKLIGDVPSSGVFDGRACSVRGNLAVFDSGKVYFQAREITVFAGNS